MQADGPYRSTKEMHRTQAELQNSLLTFNGFTEVSKWVKLKDDKCLHVRWVSESSAISLFIMIRHPAGSARNISSKISADTGLLNR